MITEMQSIKYEDRHSVVAIGYRLSATSRSSREASARDIGKIPKLKADCCELKRSFGVLIAEKIVLIFFDESF